MENYFRSKFSLEGVCTFVFKHIMGFSPQEQAHMKFVSFAFKVFSLDCKTLFPSF